MAVWGSVVGPIQLGDGSAGLYAERERERFIYI